MAETNMGVFTTGCAGFVHSCILAPLVQHLNAKGYAVTQEELAAVLQLPVARSPSPAVLPGPAVPSMNFGGAVPAAAASTSTGRKSSVGATATPVAGRTCMYQFKRGEHKGKFCPKATAPGVDFCNSCLKTRKNLGKETGGAVPGAAPGMGMPGMAGVPNGYATPVPAVPSSSSGSGQPGQLSVVEFDATRGLFKDPNHGFIVYQLSSGPIAVIGKHSESDGRVVPLTDAERITAEAIGLVIANTNETEMSEPDLPAPTSQVISTPQAIPSGSFQGLPQVPPLATPSVDLGIPQIPGIPQMGNSMPQIMGVPQIPGIPQIPM